eukprot:g10201.t1
MKRILKRTAFLKQVGKTGRKAVELLPARGVTLSDKDFGTAFLTLRCSEVFCQRATSQKKINQRKEADSANARITVTVAKVDK